MGEEKEKRIIEVFKILELKRRKTINKGIAKTFAKKSAEGWEVVGLISDISRTTVILLQN